MRLLTFSLCSMLLALSVRAVPPDSVDARREMIELDVIRDVVESRFGAPDKAIKQPSSPEKTASRLYFLTATPTRKWAENGRWKSLPESFHNSLRNLTIELFPAVEAQLVDRAIFRAKDGKEGWMYTVYVSKWISDTEVEVEQDLHRSPQHGSGTRETWIKSGES